MNVLGQSPPNGPQAVHNLPWTLTIYQENYLHHPTKVTSCVLKVLQLFQVDFGTICSMFAEEFLASSPSVGLMTVF